MNALVVSLNFHPGHVCHLIASYKQCEELGYTSFYYVDPEFEDYLPSDSRIITSRSGLIRDIDLAVFLFPSQKNILLLFKLKLKHSKILYVFHEPLARMNVYREAGFSFLYLVKLWIIDKVNIITVRLSNGVLLPSKKAVQYYESNNNYSNRHYHYLPLMFDDEYIKDGIQPERRYFSYIGTIAADHSFNEYLRFVKWAISKGKVTGLSFLIATRTDFNIPEELKNSSRVVIKKGKPLSEKEINDYYSQSLLIWNAYARCTQSGVLAKSFMFGTPAIVLEQNLNEFTVSGYNVVAISDNTSFDQIEGAILKVQDSFNEYSLSCRCSFESFFYYRVYNSTIKDILSHI